MPLRKRELMQKKLKVSMEAGVREPFVIGDLEQLKQVFFNVIGNAIDAIPKTPKYRILLGWRRHFVFAKIIDHGSGIAKENISKGIRAVLYHKKKGHGIGMMIVHRIMRDHWRRSGIDSKEGCGTIVLYSFLGTHPRRKLLASHNTVNEHETKSIDS